MGGTGFVGTAVVDALRAREWDVRVLSRRTGFDLLRPDPEALRGCDAVVNLAGIKREEGGQTFQAVHVDAVHALIAAMKAVDVRRLLHVSVVAAKEKPEWPYHHTKWLGEKAARESGLEWTILRPGVIYGEGDDLLTHLALMLRFSSIFPIAGSGAAPMMPVDVKDVASAVGSALEAPPGKSFDVVGPDRLTLREVVQNVARAVGRRAWILPTPVALMRLPVTIMEKFFRTPLSTRAQLNMLVEGLAGDPEPARKELGLEPAPFTPTRLRSLVPQAPFRKRVPLWRLLILLTTAFALIGLGFSSGADVWKSLFLGNLALGVASLTYAAARRFKGTPFLYAAGAAIGLAQFGVTKIVVAGLAAGWPAFETMAAALYKWKGAHPPSYLLPTLVAIVFAEELLWRGVVTRFFAERFGRWAGVAGGSILFAAAHLAAGNPLLVAAALVAGAFWSWLAEAFDDLTVPFTAHLVWDVLLLFVWPVIDT